VPLFNKWNIGPHAAAAIWQADEPESFFSGHTGITSDIKNEKRRVEHLAGRFLLQYLVPGFPLHEIQKDRHDKPRTNNNGYFFSISHSWPYIAAVISTHSEVGIDIQTWNPRIPSIQHKFLSPDEQLLFKNEISLITAAWTAKEAAYKWNGRRNVDFIEDMPITTFIQNAHVNNIHILSKLSEKPALIYVDNIINACFSCSYVIPNETQHNQK